MRTLVAFINTFMILLLSLATVILVVACVVIFKRIRQAQGAADKARRQTSEEWHRDPECRATDTTEEQER